MAAVIRFALKVVLMAVVFYLVARYVPGIEVQTNPSAVLGISVTFAWLALLFAVVNAVVGPVLRFLSFPAILLSLGLFLLVINAALFGLTAALSSRLDVDGFGAAVLGGLLVSLASWFLDLVLDR